MTQLQRGRKKDSDAPRGVYRHASGGWAIRYTCSAGCKHKERTGPLKSEATRRYYEQRNRAKREPGWCPNAERQKAREQVQTERARQKARVTFRAYADSDYLPAAQRLKGIATVRCRVQAMVRHFGDTRLDEITPAAVERYLQGLLSDKCSQPTVNRYRGILSAMFSRAKRFGLVAANPVTGATKYREPEGRTLYLLAEGKAQEESAIREALRPDLRPLFTISIHMGFRWSEQIALEWQDVDFFVGSIGVQRSKSGYSRMVPMNSIVRSALMDLAAQRQTPEDPSE
jgi:integrase